LRDLIAVAQESSLELTAGDSAIEIDSEGSALFRCIDMRPSGNAGEIFFGTWLA